jgi:hypothetical protein
MAEIWKLLAEKVKAGESSALSQLPAILLTRDINEIADLKMKNWLVKDEFESSSMYRERTSELKRKETYHQFQNEALNSLIPSSRELQQYDFQNYDADNEIFVLENSIFNEIALFVPLSEARLLRDVLPIVKISDLECDLSENYEFTLRSFKLAYGNTNNTYYLNEDFGFFETANSGLQYRDTDSQTGKSSGSDAYTGKRLALVIGNGEYIHGDKLLNPANDANSIKTALEDLGFVVMEYKNLELTEMRRAIDDFGHRLSSYDVGLFFYAGHGLQENSKNYLIPVDAKLETENDVSQNCVDMGRLLGKMEDAGNSTNIIILDACRDNPFERSWTRSTNEKGLAFMHAPTGSLIAYATSPGFTISDGTGVNSLYTSAILNFISSPDQSIINMFQDVRRQVRSQSNGQQVPWETSSLERNFYFVPSSD